MALVLVPLLEYRENGQTVTVRTDDGCLKYRRDPGGRAGDIVQEFCAWQRPEGVAEWAPQTAARRRSPLLVDRAWFGQPRAFGRPIFYRGSHR